MSGPSTRPDASPLRLTLADRPAVLRSGVAPFVLSLALCIVAGAAAAVSLGVPSVLLGPDVTIGNVRGTALVVLVMGLPMILIGMSRVRAQSARGLPAWLGGLAYVTYQAVLFCFGTPMNRLFLLYVTWLGLAVWSVVVLLRRVDVDAFLARTDPRLHARSIAAFLAVFAVLNGLAWVARILPAVFSDDPGSPLAGSGMTTSPVWVQDLAFWIPAAIVAAVGLWRRSAWGTLLTGGMLAFYVAECVSIASDQWWGARADTSHPDLASTAMVAPAMVVAALTVVPLALYLANVDRAGSPGHDRGQVSGSP